MTQTLIIIGLGVFVIWVINKLWRQGKDNGFFPKRKPHNACPKCDGEGHWEGLRGRERCDRCKGSGVLND